MKAATSSRRVMRRRLNWSDGESCRGLILMDRMSFNDRKITMVNDVDGVVVGVGFVVVSVVVVVVVVGAVVVVVVVVVVVDDASVDVDV